MSEQKGTRALMILEHCSRCYQSNILLTSSLLKLLITNKRGCLEIQYEMTFTQNILCKDGQVELVFLSGFLKKPEILDPEIIAENLKNYGWDKYSILLVKAGVKKFKESFEKSEKVIHL